MSDHTYLEEFTTRDAAAEWLESQARKLRESDTTRIKLTLTAEFWKADSLLRLTMASPPEGQKVGRMAIATEDHPSAASVRRLRKIVAGATEEKP